MGDGTKIEWSDATWQIITGCSVLSPGCSNCYAMKLAGTRLRHHPSRAGLTAPSKAGPVWTGEVRFNEQWLDQPLKWARPRDIFVCAHGDLFHESVPDEWIDKVFAVMAIASRHRFQVLTKRSARMRAAIARMGKSIDILDRHARSLGYTLKYTVQPELAAAVRRHPGEVIGLVPWPLPNVYLGISAERQKEWDERKGDLAATPAAVRFASFEPLIGPIIEPRLLSDFLSWAIVGGESGAGARPMHPAWPRSLRDQCAAAGVPFFFKQHGEWLCELGTGNYRPEPGDLVSCGDGHIARRVGKKAAGRLLDGVEHNGMPGDQP